MESDGCKLIAFLFYNSYRKRHREQGTSVTISVRLASECRAMLAMKA